MVYSYLSEMQVRVALSCGLCSLSMIKFLLPDSSGVRSTRVILESR